MKQDKILYLISTIPSVNELGDPINTEVERKVFASESSIRQNEFYQAKAVGLKPQITLKIRKREYKGEMIVKYQNTKYKVLRTFTKNNVLELILTGDING